MTFNALMTRSVVVRRNQPVALDSYGNEQPRSFVADPPTVGYLEQVVASELLTGQSTQDSTHLLVLPPGTLVGSHDQVEVDGVSYEVVAPPSRPHHPHTGPGEHHVEVRLRLVEG